MPTISNIKGVIKFSLIINATAKTFDSNGFPFSELSNDEPYDFHGNLEI